MNLFLRITARIFRETVHATEKLIERFCPYGTLPYLPGDAFPWIQHLEDNWQEIRRELDELLATREVPSFHEISEEQKDISRGDDWKSFPFYVFGTPIEQNCRICPRTDSLLQTVPGLQNAMFSILAPGAEIPQHRGPYKGLLRYHLALQIPQSGQCSIWVRDVESGWTEGKSLILDDSYPHRVTNDTDGRRTVLFADFIRPLPWPLSWWNRAIIRAFANSPLAKKPVRKSIESAR